jgi:choline dehydrogenase
MSETTPDQPEVQRFEYIVIGGGTAGALLCKRLTQDKQTRVLLIEAGKRDDYHWIHIPVGYLRCIGNPRTDWMYQTEPQPGLNGRSLRYPRGKVLGGSSSINGMIYMRGQSRDYDAWAQAVGDMSWSWDNCLPDFTQHEDHYKLDPAPEGKPPVQMSHKDFSPHLHGNKSKGSTGEWRVEKQRLRWDILDAFSDAAQQAGIPATDDFNRGTNEGVGYFEVNQKEGWRWNTAKAFLRPACYGRTNFEMWTKAQVVKLLTERREDGSVVCTGVRVWSGLEMVDVHAEHEVILCAGSIGSVQLLQLSGIGPADLLQQHGIEVVQDLPGVGENLQDHLQIRSVYQVDGVPTLNTLSQSTWGKLKIAYEYATKRTGPMSMAPSQLGAFTRSSEAHQWPNLEYHVQPLSLDAFGEPLHNFNAFTASVCNLNPTSRGHVRIKSANFSDVPAISPNYLSTETDRQVAAESLRVTRRIVGQSALAKYKPKEIKPGVQYQSDEDLARLAGEIGTTIFHPVGTTKMGRDDDPMAVVNSQLQVRGVANLRVVDAGIMPTITSGNTASPTLMIAEKAARWIVQARKRQHEA